MQLYIQSQLAFSCMYAGLYVMHTLLSLFLYINIKFDLMMLGSGGGWRRGGGERENGVKVDLGS